MSTSMTSRERLLTAVSHEQPDKVPLDFGGLGFSSIVVEGYDRLKEHFGATSERVLINRHERSVMVDERILRELDIDTRGILMGEPIRKELAQDLGSNRNRDIWGVERLRPEGGYYYDIVHFPLAGDITVADIANFPWPDPEDPGLVQGVKQRLEWIRKNTDCAAVLALPAPVVHTTQYLRGFEDWYLDFVLHRDVLEALFDAVLEYNMQVARRLLMEVGREVDIVACGDDLGSQVGLMVSREHFTKYIKPRLANYFRQIHDLSPAKILFHTCGGVFEIVDDLIEIGVDILQSVQVGAKGMDPVELKKKFRGKMAFWGGMTTQSVLPLGNIQDVKKMVEARIEQMADGGGYVLSADSNIQPDVPMENILVMFRHAREYIPLFVK